MSLPALIKSYRARHGLTQAQCADRWGVPVRTLQNWEARLPASAMARAISALLGELDTGERRT